MAATVDMLISELDGMKSFLESLEASGSDHAHETKVAMVRTIVAKIHMAPMMDFHGCARLTDSVSKLAAVGVIDGELRNSLTTAVVQKMQGQGLASPMVRKTPQVCLRADRYLLDEDWTFLEATGNIQTRLSYIRDIMHKVGITNPTESTLKVLVAIVCCAGGHAQEPAEQKYECLKQLKALFHSFRPNHPDMPHLVNYPDHPKFLDESWRGRAYGDCLPPDEDLRQYNVNLVAGSVPCRSSNANVRGSSIRRMSSSSAIGADTQQIVGQLAQLLQGGSPNQASAVGGLQNLHIFPGVANRRGQNAAPAHAICPGQLGRDSATGQLPSQAGGTSQAPTLGMVSEQGLEQPHTPTFGLSSTHLQPPTASLLPLPAPDWAVSAGGAKPDPASELGACPTHRLGSALEQAVSAALVASSSLQGSVDSAMSDPRVGLEELDRMEALAQAAADAKQAADKCLKKPASAKPMVKTATKNNRVAKPELRKYTTEWSRSQIVCDSGIKGPGRYHTISFKKAGSALQAKRMADKWVAEGSV